MDLLLREHWSLGKMALRQPEWASEAIKTAQNAPTVNGIRVGPRWGYVRPSWTSWPPTLLLPDPLSGPLGNCVWSKDLKPSPQQPNISPHSAHHTTNLHQYFIPQKPQIQRCKVPDQPYQFKPPWSPWSYPTFQGSNFHGCFLCLPQRGLRETST